MKYLSIITLILSSFYTSLFAQELPPVSDDEVDIVDDLVSRVVDDAEFRKRQALIGNIALFMKKIGAINFVKLFPNFLPYMKLSFRKHR